VDNILSEDEETLRTLGDQPVLIWHSSYSDPPDLDRSALTPEEDLPGWVSLVTPPGCRKLGPGMTDIRRYDGDASTVLSMWSVGGESPTSKSGPRCGWWAGGGGGRRQASVQERRRVQKEATPGQRRRELRICRWRPEERRVG
jgi:hypothetical protein